MYPKPTMKSTDWILNRPSFRHRYKTARVTLMQLKLTFQLVALPEEAGEQVDPSPLLLTLIEQTRLQIRREVRFLSALDNRASVRGWRIRSVLGLLEVFDDVAACAPLDKITPEVKEALHRLQGWIDMLLMRFIELHILV